MTGEPACEVCGAPTGDHALLCRDCTRQLGDTLWAIARLATDLDQALARQARFTDRGPHHGNTTVLPYDPRAAETADQLRAVLSGWIRVLTEARP